MGMGKLLDLNITNLPRRLGLWLVQNFDPRSCTLQLQNGQSVHITATYVAATLGLPIGHIEITRRTTRAVPEILKEWRGIFEKTTACITSGAMTTKMLEAEADDPWFKRHFALLVISVLIDPMINGYVNQNYIDHLRDVDNIPNLNWCQMVINSLVLDIQALLKGEENEIKSGGFGYGHIDSALQLENAPPEEEGTSIPQADVQHQPQPQEESPTLLEGLHVNTNLQTT
nr:uncharacterized protein LOC109191529 [Ipomoea batatas]